MVLCVLEEVGFRQDATIHALLPTPPMKGVSQIVGINPDTVSGVEDVGMILHATSPASAEVGMMFHHATSHASDEGRVSKRMDYTPAR